MDGPFVFGISGIAITARVFDGEHWFACVETGDYRTGVFGGWAECNSNWAAGGNDVKAEIPCLQRYSMMKTNQIIPYTYTTRGRGCDAAGCCREINVSEPLGECSAILVRCIDMMLASENGRYFLADEALRTFISIAISIALPHTHILCTVSAYTATEVMFLSTPNIFT